ncbi:MAG TPA: HXXEE domain-containing protein [Thermoanaerobaculia bacterium]|nr:HXXEE domain-containing protein [Thermoanaerobaculia bacterium]
MSDFVSEQDGPAIAGAGARRRAWWLLVLPASYLLHLAEEWWGGEGFAMWTARAVGSPVSTSRFLVLNGIVWPLFFILTVMAILRPKLAWFPATFATVILINTALHALGALATSSYSPGLITGLLLYLPSGLAALSLARRSLTPASFTLAVLSGVFFHGLVIAIAFA